MSIKHLLNKKYPERVDIEYFDVTDTKADNFPEVKKHLDNPGTPLPLISFDGIPMWAGAVSYPHIVQELTRRGIE